MLDDLFKYILNKVPPKAWKIQGVSVGDDFDSIINESPLYENSKIVKGGKAVLFYKSENSNSIKGIFLAIPFFKNKNEEVLESIKKNFGEPYFNHLKMNNQILYYTSFDLYVKILNNAKGLCLSIGDCGDKLQKFSASNIIDAYVELMNHKSFVFEMEDKDSTSKLTLIKIRMLKALLLAFMGNHDIKRFERGHFILESDDQYWNKLLRTLGEIEIYESPKKLETTIVNHPSRFEMYKFWEMLFKYYLNSQEYIKKTLVVNNTTWKKKDLESFKITKSRENIIIRMDALKKELSKFIDPDEKLIDLKEMTLKYGYPKEDIGWIKANDY